MEHHLVNHGLCSALSQLFELRDKDNLNRGKRFLLVSSPLFFGGVFFFFSMFPLLHGGSCSVLFSSSSVCLFPWLSLGEKKNLKSVLFFTLTVGFKTVRNGKKKRITTKSAFPTAASAVFCHIDTENRLDLFTKLFHSGFTLNPLCAARLMICWQQMHVSVTLKNVSGWN